MAELLRNGTSGLRCARSPASSAQGTHGACTTAPGRPHNARGIQSSHLNGALHLGCCAVQVAAAPVVDRHRHVVAPARHVPPGVRRTHVVKHGLEQVVREASIAWEGAHEQA